MAEYLGVQRALANIESAAASITVAASYLAEEGDDGPYAGSLSGVLGGVLGILHGVTELLQTEDA